MLKQNYLLSEDGSDQVFAVISQVNGLASLSNTELINKVGLAIEEEFCYEERVKVIHDSFRETNGTLYMSFNCLADGDEEEIREVELNLTAIY